MTPIIVNTTLTDANTEYSVDLSNARYFSMQCRTAAVVRFAFVTGKVATPTAPYATMKADSANDSSQPVEGAEFDGTIYLASPTAGAVVELVYWT